MPKAKKIDEQNDNWMHRLKWFCVTTSWASCKPGIRVDGGKMAKPIVRHQQQQQLQQCSSSSNSVADAAKAVAAAAVERRNATTTLKSFTWSHSRCSKICVFHSYAISQFIQQNNRWKHIYLFEYITFNACHLNVKSIQFEYRYLEFDFVFLFISMEKWSIDLVNV